MLADWYPPLPIPPWLLLAYIAMLGAAIGSFLTLATYRLPRGEPIGLSRSRCPCCGTPLGARDLVPVFSWAIHQGRCRHCKARVSIRYPLTELACAAGAVIATCHYGLNLEALAMTGLWWCIVALVITDLEHTIILDEVQIAIGLFGLLYGYALGVPGLAMLEGAATGAAIGLLLKYGFLYLRNKDGLGMGDVKFLVVAGIWLADGASFIPFLFFSGLLGIASGLIWRACGLGERFPFGPALAFALLLCIAVPEAAHGFWGLYGLLR